MVVHRFACRLPAYRGWYWAVVLTRAPRSKVVTVDEVVLLPGDGAMLAPDWVPWSDRIQAGDLGVGDLLPTAADDPRLALRLTDVDELSDDLPFFELGLGRARVLSLEGRELAATRWYEGEPGPSAAISRSAPAQCGTCGFYVRLVGGLGRLFGVCGNEFAPDDASVVADDHGCGAHSEALVLPSAHPQPVRSTTTPSRPSRKQPPSPRSRSSRGPSRLSRSYSPTLRPRRRSLVARRRQ